ncbi:MAG TPA: tRNA guanosine(34) transglycosylase Tgt [Candidatus Dormibacteraeota bacterium]|jgi:queuine tRNA-ribosyltransferase|nr:tRNA guanosine(34) transglycosylase Tgt [Candidatus Dormibacteraeota bacterium]
MTEAAADTPPTSPLSPLRIDARDGAARTGILHTPHGDVRTPAFMPVGTHATVKACMPDEVKDTGADILLCNGYHLLLRPGVDLIERAGGLHAMMRWDGPILTDSGGYQLVSLQDVAGIDDEGATFVSPYDGTRMRITPEEAVGAQARLGADIVMCLDHPVAFGADAQTTREATERTHRWAERCREAHPGEGHLLFGITQGGFDPVLRRESAREIAGMGFDGVAIGGLALGEPPPLMQAMARAALTEIPEATARYVMGLGTDAELLAMVGLGIDMFDCVLPTRLARNGTALTAGGRLSLRQSRHREVLRPLEEDCPCPACSGGFTRAYLRHLFQAGEILGHRLVSLHNLTHLGTLMDGARAAIAGGAFEGFRAEVLEGLAGGVDSPAARRSPVGYSSRP